MYRVVQAEVVHLLDEEACAVHHHLDVAGLHREDEVMVVLRLAYLRELQRALRHALGGVAVAAHDALGERAVVGADAHGGVVALADVNERGHTLPYPLQLVVVFLLGELQLAGIPIRVVAGVDAHLLHQRGGHLGGLGVEVDVGDEGHLAAATEEFLLDAAEVLGGLHVGRRDAHQLTARLHHA